MKTIDLDDLPPRVAQSLAALAPGEEVALTQAGAVVARLAVAERAAPAAEDALADLPPEERMKEVLEQFDAMIRDEF